MYEFDTSFNVNTGSLNQVFSGSGVHLNKDVTFSFGILDHQANPILSDQQLIANPLVNTLVFDILDEFGNVVFPSYLSGGTSRSITIKESDNYSIFGEYKKDFGVRLSMTNFLDSQTFTGVFYAYGNVPEISSCVVSDGSIAYCTSTSQVFDEIAVELQIANNLKYITFDRYDIYASTGNDIVLYNDPSIPPQNHDNFLYSQKIQNLDNLYNISIKPFGLDYDVYYYFTIVPYSNLGSGAPITFGPNLFARDAIAPTISIISSNQFELFDGDESMNLAYTTGIINNATGYPIDIFESGLYNTLAYTVQIQTGEYFTSSELKLVLDSTGMTLLESPINNTGQLQYIVDQSGFYYVLYVSGVDPTGLYKIYKTSI